MFSPRISKSLLWPTPVMFAEFMGPDVDFHNRELESAVLAGCRAQQGADHELRLYELEECKSASISWLVSKVREM